MGSYRERTFLPLATPPRYVDSPALVADVTTIDLGDAGAADTFTLTPTRVDTGTAGTATGAITWDATPATLAAAIQTAVRALGGIYADAVVAEVTDPDYTITLAGVGAGYDVTWAVTDPTTFTPGSVVETTPGAAVYTGFIPIGRFSEVKKIAVVGFNDASLVVDVVDFAGKDVFSATIDTSTAGDDTPYVRMLSADGVEGSDGASSGTADGGLFKGPLAVTITTSVPLTADARAPRLTLTTKDAVRTSHWLERTVVASAFPINLSLGAAVAKIKRIRLEASDDTSHSPTLTDADGFVVYTKSATDYTTAVEEQLTHDGVDQAGNAVTNLSSVIAKSPLTLSGAALSAGTFTVKVWAED